MIEFRLEDGRVLEIDAPDQVSAAEAAKTFLDREAAQQSVTSEYAQRGPVGRLLYNFVDGTNQLAAGIPLVGGLVDEGNATLASGGGLWGDYGKWLEYYRERQRQAAERSPAASGVNSLAGGLGGGGAMVKALPAGASVLLPESSAARVVAGMATGAAGSAVEGVTRGEGGFDNRIAELGPSAAFGAVAGGFAPVVAKGMGMGWNAVTAYLANRGVDAKSINALLERLQAQGVTAHQAQARIVELGDEAMLADVTRGMQAYTAGVALADAGAGNTIGQRLAKRREGDGDRMRDILDEAFGPVVNPYTVRKGQREIHPDVIHDQRAFNEGRTDVLKAGPDTMTQAELEARIAQSAESENMFRRQGTRTELDRIMTNMRGDPDASVDRVMTRDWNDRKIASMIGPRKARNLDRSLDAEATFAETSNLAEPARQSRTAIINTARDLWGSSRKPGTLSDMLATGAATAATTGSSSAGVTAALGIGANRLGRHFGNVLAPKIAPLIQKTAENLTEQGEPIKALVRALAGKEAAMSKRSQMSQNIERIARALLAIQAGRAGYEGRDLLFGGPR